MSTVDLSTTYLGLKLEHPVVPSASPLSKNVDAILQLEDAGASAVVMYSLFEEQISLEGQALDFFLNHGAESFPEALSYLPDLQHYNVSPDAYLELISRAKRSTRIPIIGSLNGVTTGGWIEHAKLIEQAGADALELNVYTLPGDLNLSGADVEARLLEVVREVRANVNLPLAVKLSPFYSALPNLAMQLSMAGADALVLFNRFYQPDIDLETLEAVPALRLSTSDELRLRLRWLAMLHGRVPLDLAVTGGVHTHLDALKGLFCGARVAFVASELLQHGVNRLHQIVADLDRWLETHEYTRLEESIGSLSHRHLTDPSAYERANYLKVLDSWRSPTTVSSLR
jgi:dihydroorotate dehydrogenase (fumarate)